MSTYISSCLDRQDNICNIDSVVFSVCLCMNVCVYVISTTLNFTFVFILFSYIYSHRGVVVLVVV